MNRQNKTGYVYDPIFLQHDHTIHHENSERLKAILAELNSTRLLKLMEKIPSRPALFEELQLVHTANYIKTVKDFSQKGGGYFELDTYASPESFNAASVAVGSMIDLGIAIAKGELDNGYALLRPPGHHSLPHRAMGFCIFSNAAITVKAVRNLTSINKIAIIDFDVHHGNGTQDAFYEDGNVLFISTHQYPQYPGTGGVNEIGRGDGEGNTMNIPLPAYTGDKSIRKIYIEIINPALKRFEPEIIFVSAGYDCHWDDPLANLGLSLTGIAWISEYLIKLARDLCNGKILFVLEGGYNLHVLKSGVANCIRALLGSNEYEDKLGVSPRPEPDVGILIKTIKSIHNLQHDY